VAGDELATTTNDASSFAIAIDDDDESVVPSGRRAAKDADLPRDGTKGTAGPSRPSKATRMAINAWPRRPNLEYFQNGMVYKNCLFKWH
jgi:hypothetical protein